MYNNNVEKNKLKWICISVKKINYQAPSNRPFYVFLLQNKNYIMLFDEKF